jgi:hypothetical protein
MRAFSLLAKQMTLSFWWIENPLTIFFERMQEALNIVEKWCKWMKLTVNPGKTASILFTHKTKIDSLVNWTDKLD